MKAGEEVAQGGLGIVSLLSLFALAVQGFHPFAEDGGLYVAGIKRVLDPAMYGPHPEFVTAPMRFSLFAPLLAEMTRLTHLPLSWVLLIVDCASVWLTLFAAWMLVSRCVESRAGRAGAVTLLACWLTMPIAGTSLMLMDPYVTARSLSTPLVLLALAWTCDGLRGEARGWLLCGLALAGAAAVHPLMAGYGVAAVLVLACAGARWPPARRWGAPVLCGAAVLCALAVQAGAQVESADYVRIAMTRYYWFPFRWQWYEQLGLFAPLGLLLWLHGRGGRRWQALARMAVGLGLIALVVAALFSQVRLATHLVARLQPLRCFQMVYEVMILLLGAWLGERWMRGHAWRWAAMLAVCGGAMFFVQRQTYPESAHMEMPWAAPRNPWEQAFVWARDHTPRNAVFALDARYITRGRQEDAQCFRAIAERDALPDYSKDGGEAAIAPGLAGAWVRGQAAQTGLEQASDMVREERVRPLGATWAVLEATSETAWECPYANGAVKVCRVP